MATDTREKLRVNVRRLLEFFDEKTKGSQGHATAIVSVAGEDLGAGLLKHCLERTRDAKVTVLREPVNTGKQKGPRLDRWVDVIWPDGSGQLFQVEIKNWSAHAIGGRTLDVEASPDEVSRYKIDRWLKERWHDKQPWRGVAKVLTPMKRPDGANPGHLQEPLLIYWFALHPKGDPESFFSFPLWPGVTFSRIWFFSMSSYLRSLKGAVLELEMPNTIRRISWLHDLFPA